MARWIGILSWVATMVVILAIMGPVWGHWSDTVVMGFGGADACLQTGLLEWSAAHWHEPAVWRELPIFYPLPGSIGYMDSLLGQALLIAPARALFGLSWPAQYNLAFLLSLILAALGAASMWWAAGGARWAAGAAALAMITAPYTLTQLPHLNQLPPPFVLFAMAATLMALRRQHEQRRTWPWWWAVAFCLIAQAAWGWYGFSYAAMGVLAVLVAWVVHWLRRREPSWPPLRRALLAGILPAIVAVGGVMWLAQPLLDLQERYRGFERDRSEVLYGSADIKHLFTRGVYRSGPADWVGRGEPAETRHLHGERVTVSPGAVALLLAAFGWWRRGYLACHQRRMGRALVVLALVGLVLAFGDSVGLPFTDRRLPLPLTALREVVPAFKAFRGVWRFSWLIVIAAAWWSAVGVVQLERVYREEKRRGWIAPLALALMAFFGLPGAVPSLRIPFERAPEGPPAAEGPVLTLPAPRNEYLEDVTEASWLLRAQEIGRPVTGGATGWVPPEIVAQRTRLFDCERGTDDAQDVFQELQAEGVILAEIVLRPGDVERISFWRRELEKQGARPVETVPRAGYETYRLR